MRGQAALLGVLVLGAAALSYRQSQLVERLDALAEQLGETDLAQPAGATAADRSAPAHTADSHEDRLHALEASLARARADVRSLEHAIRPPAEPVVSNRQVLGVLKEHGTKVLETQMKYHRERWLDQRQVALADFARRYQLDPKQSDVLWGLLSDEIDRMIEILLDPASAEDPELAAAQWKEMLHETDSGAHRVLPPQSTIAWDQTRFVERKLLWPWLPD